MIALTDMWPGLHTFFPKQFFAKNVIIDEIDQIDVIFTELTGIDESTIELFLTKFDDVPCEIKAFALSTDLPQFGS